MRRVPGVGVEPTRLSSVDFESTASANSATRASKISENEKGSASCPRNFRSKLFLPPPGVVAVSLPSPTRSFGIMMIDG